MLRSLFALACITCLGGGMMVAQRQSEGWTRFRGPNGSGVSADKGFPTSFGADNNLVWRIPVRTGKSSPVLTERKIYLTSSDSRKLYTHCFDRASGTLLWERAIDRARNSWLTV